MMMPMDTGSSILLVGIMGMLLWAAIALSNSVGAVMWLISMLVFVMVLTFGLPIELLYISLIVAVLSLIVGVAVRIGA